MPNYCPVNATAGFDGVWIPVKMKNAVSCALSWLSRRSGRLVAAEEVAGVEAVAHVGQTGVVAVGEDHLTAALELGEVTHDFAAEEGAAGRQ